MTQSYGSQVMSKTTRIAKLPRAFLKQQTSEAFKTSEVFFYSVLPYLAYIGLCHAEHSEASL